MFFSTYGDIVGVSDATSHTVRETLYLLDVQLRVIGVRAGKEEAPRAALGDYLFARYPLDASDRHILLTILNCMCDRDSYLLRAGNRPMLLLCEFYARSGIAVAVFPEGEVRELLEYPAEYADTLSGMWVKVAPAGLCRKAPMSEHGYRIIRSWLDAVNTPLFDYAENEVGNDVTVAAAALRTHRIAELCGCTVEYDFCGIASGHTPPYSMALINSYAFAIFMAVKRAAAGAAATLATHCSVHGIPTMEVSFSLQCPDDRLPELDTLQEEVFLRRELFCVTRYPESSHKVLITASLMPKDIANANIKASQLFSTAYCTENMMYPLDIPGAPDTDT